MLDRIQSGIKPRPMRTLFYGVEGIGKSTLASQYPSPMTIAAEDGVSHLDTSSMVPTDYQDMMQMFGWLYNDYASHGFKTINIDTAGWAEQMCAKEVCRANNVNSLEDIGYGGWKRLWSDKFNELMTAASALYGRGMHVNFVAHASVNRFNNPEGEDYDRYVVQMGMQANAEKIKQWCDNVCFMNFDIIPAEKKQGMSTQVKGQSFNRRLLYCQRSAAYDAKTRFGLPAMIELPNDTSKSFEVFNQYYLQWVKENMPKAKPKAKTKPTNAESEAA